MSIWIVDSDIGGSPDRALGPGPAHEEPLLCGFIRVPGPWPSTEEVTDLSVSFSVSKIEGEGVGSCLLSDSASRTEGGIVGYNPFACL